MKIISNNKKIERNRKIGLYTSLGSLVVLVLGFILSLQSPDQLPLAYAALLVGLLASQIGIYFGNRWGRTPRIDERISQGLKGLDDRYALYHYMAPVPHLLIGPMGVWVIVPEHQAGKISFEKNRFKQKGIFFLSRWFAQEGIGRPDMEAQSYQQDMDKFLQKSLPEGVTVPTQSILVFINPKAEISMEGSPLPAMMVEKLKDYVRRKTKEQSVDMTKIQVIENLLPTESI